MDRLYNRFRRFCAFLIGAVFFVSGLMKLLDPVGAGLVVSEYYRFFGTDFLLPSSKAVAVAMALLESLLGAALMTGLWRRVIAVISLIFLCGFTVLTIILVIFNPVMDCGCFGEAVHLTHFQSLVKNLVLCALAVVAFTPVTRLGRPKRRKYVSFGIVATSVIVFSVYSLMYIPLVDFTDFKPASRLVVSSTGDMGDMYEAVFIYEKDGEQRSFTLDNLPDSTWTFVSTETRKADDAFENTVDLPFTDAAGEYRDYLISSGKAIAISVYDPEKLPSERWENIAGLVPAAYDAGYYPVVLVSCGSNELEEILSAMLPEEDAGTVLRSSYSADRKTLMTLNRSNGGATYFHDGYLIRKWSFRNLPSSQDLEKIALDFADETSAETTTAGNIVFQAFLLYSFAIILFV